MKYTTIGDTSTKISQIGLRTWQFGSSGWGYGTDFTKEDAIAVVHRALDLGINLIDTAEVYGRGNSEKIVGEAIKGYEREQIIISTKFMPLTIRPSSSIRALRKSLKRLQTSYIDIYLIHWPNPILPLGRTLHHLESMVDEGLIRFIGVSNFSTKRFQTAQQKMQFHRIQLNQINYSMARNKAEKNFLPYAIKEKITLMAYSPLAQGFLTGKYSPNNIPKGTRRTNTLFRKKNLERGKTLLDLIKIIGKKYDVTPAQVALNWLIKDIAVTAIPGAKSLDQIEANANAGKFELLEEDLHQIRRVLEQFKPRFLF
ncbi:aldo/keto reductase [Candidatus Hodarchaeum mangrovi]